MKTELQLSLFNQFESLVDLENNNKLNILSLLSSHLDFSSLIPYEVMSSYHSSVGRNPYPLISMIKAFFVKNLYGYESIEKLIDLLAASPKVRNFCGFSTIPNKSTFSRFKSTFYSLLEDIFNNLVNITEPICRKMGENFASHLIYDTSGIDRKSVV